MRLYWLWSKLEKKDTDIKKSKSDPEKFKLILVSEWIIKLYSATDVQQSELNSEKQTFLLPGMIGRWRTSCLKKLYSKFDADADFHRWLHMNGENF